MIISYPIDLSLKLIFLEGFVYNSSFPKLSRTMKHTFKKCVKVSKINVTYSLFFCNKSLSRGFVENCNTHSRNTGNLLCNMPSPEANQVRTSLTSRYHESKSGVNIGANTHLAKCKEICKLQTT